MNNKKTNPQKNKHKLHHSQGVLLINALVSYIHQDFNTSWWNSSCKRVSPVNASLFGGTLGPPYRLRTRRQIWGQCQSHRLIRARGVDCNALRNQIRFLWYSTNEVYLLFHYIYQTDYCSLRGEQMHLQDHCSLSATHSNRARFRFFFFFYQLQAALMDVADAVLWAA